MVNIRDKASAIKTLIANLSRSEKKNIQMLGALVILGLVAAAIAFEYPTISKFFKFGEKAKPAIQNTTPQVTYNFIGKISKIEKNSITVSNDTASKVVQVTSATTITKLTFVPTEKNGQKRFISQEKSLDLNSLKVGTSVEALGSTNVSQANEFIATRIRVLP